MKDDVKSKLKAKMDALASDDELDNVAGGTNKENLEILNAMAKLDYVGVNEILDAVNNSGNAAKADRIIANGVNELIQKHLGNSVMVVANTGETTNWNFSGYTGNKISHAEVINMINAKADGWEF